MKTSTKRPLTRKQKAFIQHLIDNPKDSATKAVQNTYNTTSNHSAEVIAHENLRKPEIVSELAKHSKDIENSIIETINRYRNSDKLQEVSEAMTNARYVHDKIHGKAIQQVQTTSKTININIDLTTDTSTESDA